MRADQTISKFLDSESAGVSWQAAALVVPYLAIIYTGTEKYVKALIRRLPETAATAANLVLKVGLFIMQVWLIFGVAALLLEASIITSIKEITSRDKWTLGQIIAVTVWIPCIVQWLYMVCQGIERGSSSQLASGYKVVKKDDIESVPGAADGAHLMQDMDAGARGKVPTVQTARKFSS